MSPNLVSGSVATLTDLGKDEAWLQGWFTEQPSRLGLGGLTIADDDSAQDDQGDPMFLATDGERYFCVDVQLGELEASRAFGVLDIWARRRARHPERTHVAVLVTESAGDRYRTTLEALAEHLPLVVVELQVWRGETEAIAVPHVALASEDVDLRATPALAAAMAAARVQAHADTVAADLAEVTGDGAAAVTSEAKAAGEGPSNRSEDKDDTGIPDPWGLPTHDSPTPRSTRTDGSPELPATDRATVLA